MFVFCSDSGVDRSSGETITYSHRNGVEGIVRLGGKASIDWSVFHRGATVTEAGV